MASGAASFCKAAAACLRPVFLDETQDDAGQHNGQNDPGVQVFPQQKGDHRGRDEDGDQEIGELPQKNPPGRNLFARGQLVGAVALQALLGLGRAQALGAGLQRLRTSSGVKVWKWMCSVGMVRALCTENGLS